MPAVTLEFALVDATVSVLISSRETGGEYTVCDLQSHGSIDIPAHSHSFEDQSFQVLSGNFQFGVGESSVCGGPGTSVTVPRETMVRISSAEPGRLLIVARPGGLDLFLGDAHSAVASGPAGLPPILEKHGIVSG